MTLTDYLWCALILGAILIIPGSIVRIALWVIVFVAVLSLIAVL